MTLPQYYSPPDITTQLMYTLDEAGTPWANTGAAGALNLAAAAAGPVAAAGLYANAVDFPGPAASSKFLTSGAAGTSVAEPATNVSLSCFVKVRTLGAQNILATKAYRPDASGWTTPFTAIALVKRADNLLEVWIASTGGALVTYNSGFPLEANTWTHIGVTYDGANVRVYADGVLWLTTARTGSIGYGTHGAWCIGGAPSSTDTFDGLVDDVRYESVVRSDAYFLQFGSSALVVTAPSIVATDANDLLVYSLNESGTPWVNGGSGGALDLTVKAAGPTVVAGLYGNAVAFPGVQASSKFLTSGAAGTSVAEVLVNITVSMFLYMQTYATGVFVSKNYRPDASGWTSPFFTYAIAWINSSSVIRIEMTVGGTLSVYDIAFAIPLHRWTHVGFTYDGVNVRIYIDGNLVSTQAKTGNIDYGTHGGFNIGGDASNGDTSIATIDDVRVANVVRNDAWFALHAVTQEGQLPGEVVVGGEERSGGAGGVTVFNPGGGGQRRH